MNRESSDFRVSFKNDPNHTKFLDFLNDVVRPLRPLVKDELPQKLGESLSILARSKGQNVLLPVTISKERNAYRITSHPS